MFFSHSENLTVPCFCRSGMAMTEKQGGSDVRANTTKAYCDNANEKRYILIGHK